MNREPARLEYEVFEDDNIQLELDETNDRTMPFSVNGEDVWP